uniref:SERPIN domain-containing protein n=1 Tax=Panagrellus redivivus TaxID=6233 RepID=A0A7E4VW50_PANRE
MIAIRHILIPWILSYLVQSVKGQPQVNQPLTDFHNLLLSGVANQHRLFERIAPLDGLHILHQAMAVSPVPDQQPLIGGLLRGVTPPPPLFNPHHRFLTVTVPNPLYNPNLSQTSNTPAPRAVISTDTNKKITDIIEELPKALTAAGVATEKVTSQEVPKAKGFEEIEPSETENSATEPHSHEIDISELNLAIQKIPEQQRVEGGQSEELHTVTAEPEVIPSFETSTPLIVNHSTKVSIIEEVQTTTPSPTKPPSVHTQNTLSNSFHLTDHLNHSNIESFLATTNISTGEAQNFLKLVERVLEEEVEKRLQTQNQKHAGANSKHDAHVEHVSASEEGLKLQPSDIQPSLDTSAAEKVVNEEEYVSQEEELTPHRRHELKTVDTKLSYEGEVMGEDVSAENRDTRLPILSLRVADSRAARVHSSPNLNPEKAFQNRRSHTSSKVIEDYRIREQEDFDKTIKEGALSVFGEDAAVSSQKSTPSVSTTTSTPVPLNYITRAPTHRSGPQTQFEMLAKDYQYRLSGINGLNDVFKALQNAKIGFYERPTYRRYNSRGH